MGIDDMVRAISTRGGPPTSLAVVRWGIVPVGAKVHRGLVSGSPG